MKTFYVSKPQGGKRQEVSMMTAGQGREREDERWRRRKQQVGEI